MSRTPERISYFLRAALCEYSPHAQVLSRLRLRRLLPRCLEDLPADVLDRVNHYNQLDSLTAALPSVRLGDMSIAKTDSSGKLYHIDLMRHAKQFGPEFRLDPLFGDIIHVPDRPSLLKSRPIAGNISNSVLMPLDAFRHLYFPKDPRPWSEKRPTAVWRGRLNNQAPRQAAVRLYGARNAHDIGHIEDIEGYPPAKGWLSIAQQLEHRYVLSLEGNDVATNLKWIMASNSVALSPRLEYETWYMEGRLKPGVHFVEIRPDLSDLEDQIAWCEANPDAVQNIIGNAHDWVRQFSNPRREAQIAALVLQKYAEMTGGLDRTYSPVRLFT